MRLLDLLNRSAALLARAGVDNPGLDARLLAAEVLACDRAALLAQNMRELSEAETSAIQSLINRRAAREPVARILGLREFWGLPFGLNEATLDPRPDSETLIEAALALSGPIESPPPLRGRVGWGVSFSEDGNGGAGGTHPPPSLPLKGGGTMAALSDGKSPPPLGGGLGGGSLAARTETAEIAVPTPHQASPQGGRETVLDLGTGTGCLLLALLHEWPEATGLGIDIAPRAVEQARANAARLGLEDRAAFRVGHWLEGVASRFDVVISNPPYIASAEIPHLMPEVRAHDPLAALDGGADGLEPYRLLIPQLPNVLKPQGLAVFEVGQGQDIAVADLFRRAGFTSVATRRDLGGIERCVLARYMP